MQQIADVTENGYRQVLQAGLATVQSSPPPTETTQNEWPSELIDTYLQQESIG